MKSIKIDVYRNAYFQILCLLLFVPKIKLKRSIDLMSRGWGCFKYPKYK